jgi:hypothetical protein
MTAPKENYTGVICEILATEAFQIKTIPKRVFIVAVFIEPAVFL